MNAEECKAERKQQISGSEPVLLAEDNEDDILSIYQALKGADIPNPLFVVYDGQHAIDYLSGTGRFTNRKKYPLPCLVLLNTNLPEKNGFEVLEWVRQQGDGVRKLPVIMMASFPRKKELKKANQFGANDYLLKSFSEDEKLEWAKGLKR